jgi:hypothetical protein
MVISEPSPKPKSIPCGCLLYAIFCPVMLAAVVLFAVGTAIVFILSCGRFPCGDSDSGSVPQPQQQKRRILFPSKGAVKSRFICDDDLNEITVSNRQYSGGSYV